MSKAILCRLKMVKGIAILTKKGSFSMGYY